MSKRKLADSKDTILDTPSKRSRRAPRSEESEGSPKKASGKTPKSRDISARNGKTVPSGDASDSERSGSPTPNGNGQPAFSTPRKGNKSTNSTPSRTKKADQSAKRKSARRIVDAEAEDDWDGENALAAAILDEEEEDIPSRVEDTVEVDASTPTTTPSKRGRGRPKGAKNKRSPTPEGDIAPEERYFFQNRSGPPQYSTNKFSTVKLLTHDEYFEQMRNFQDHHKPEKAYLMKLHARSFPQWKFELSEGYSACLYGYGSKRQLVTKFAEWLRTRTKPHPRIVIVNGYTPKLSIRNILATIGSALVADDETLKLIGQPQEMLDTVLSRLSQYPPVGRLVVMVNSIDASALRKGSVQSILARLASHPLVSLLATADTPTFPLMWNSSLLDHFNFAFHDCTTFATYDAEISVVDEIYDLLGRKGRRMGGKDGIGFVLKSLPPNARNLYRILLSEILSILGDGLEIPNDDAADDEDRRHAKQTNESAEEVGIEYRLLYQKASEEFICSSDMNFRFLLKEFHDHQMITSRRDASGTELLCVPLGKDEMQAVLEDLVVA